MIVATIAIARREFVRTLRQPAFLVGTVLTPLLAWLLFASGFARAITPEAADDYATYLAPGTALLIVLFGSLYAGMTLADERERALVQTLAAEGCPAASVALGKLLAGAVISTTQALLVIALLPLAGGSISAPAALLAVPVLLLASIGAGGVSAWLAAYAKTPRSFHGLINLLLVPAWMLSGAIFPLDTASGWIRGVSLVNPASWAHAALSQAMLQQTFAIMPTIAIVAFACAGAALATLGVARAIVRTPRARPAPARTEKNRP